MLNGTSEFSYKDENATQLRDEKKLFVRVSELRSNFHLKSLNQITNHSIT